MTLLSCRGLGVRRSGASRFRPVRAEFELHPGDRLLILGPSGCGKSTLALALDGLIPQLLAAELRGAVLINERSHAGRPLHEITADVALVFQDPDAQLFTQNVLDEVCFALENRLVSAEEAESRAKTALRATGLWELRDRDGHELSGGQKQRLALACALASDTRLLVLDEPSANLDPVARGELYTTLAALPEPQQRAIVLIDHNIDDALPLVNRVLVLDSEGRAIRFGDTRDILSDPDGLLAELGVQRPLTTTVRERLRARGIKLPDPGDRPALAPAELARSLKVLADRGAQMEPERGQPDDPAHSTPQPPAVAVEELRFLREGQPVLRDVSFLVPHGSFTAIVGSNGAGKTTLLHLLAGLLRPQAGTIRVDGRLVRPRGPSPIGLVFQNPGHQFVEASVLAELTAAADPSLLPQEREERARTLLRELGLEDDAERHPAMLSGGQQRRLSVATALIGGHRTIAFDEPTFGQDAAGASGLLELFGQLCDRGVSLIVVTHDMQLVADCATHVIVLHDGLVTAAGEVSDALDAGTLQRAGLRPPPLAECTRMLPAGCALRELTRLSDLDRIRMDREPAAKATPKEPLREEADKTRLVPEQNGADGPADTRVTENAPHPAKAGSQSALGRDQTPWIVRRNPLARLLASLGPILWAFSSDDPRVSLFCAGAATLLILIGVRLPWQRVLASAVTLPIGCALLALLFALWVDPDRAANGGWSDEIVLAPGPLGVITLSAVLAGAVPALRIAAIILCSLLAGLGSSRTTLVDALIQNARMPYRIGYTLFAAMGFLPYLRAQLTQIRAAHRVRGGARARGNIAFARRAGSVAVALLVDAVQHAGRISFAIESRSFGAHPQRTWRRTSPWDRADTTYVLGTLTATIAAAIIFAVLPGPHWG